MKIDLALWVSLWVELPRFVSIIEKEADPKADELCPLINYLNFAGERLDSDLIRAVTLSSQSVGPIIGVPFPPVPLFRVCWVGNGWGERVASIP